MKISKTLGATLLTVALVAGPVCAATASPATAAVQASPAAALDLFKTSNRQVLIETFDGINAFRASKGLKPLKFNVAISSISQKWSDRMASTGSFVHNGDYVSGAPGGWSSASENIAWSTYAPSGQRFVDMWINSPGHNANMSRPDDDYMGVGISSRDGGIYATANHFSYLGDKIPSGTYNHPRDFFDGRPALPTSGGNVATATAPVINWANGTYTIPAQTGVIFMVGGVVKAAGTYAASSATIVITAKAAAGYALTSTPTWTFDLSSYAVSAAAPVFNRAKATYTIPAKAGVTYLANGVVKAAGTYSANSKVTITAKALAPNFVTGTTTWTYDLAPAKATAAAPDFNLAAGTFTIPKRTGVTYFVDGNAVAAGTTKGNSRRVAVTAVASPGYVLSGAAAWTLDFRKAVTAAKPAMSSSTNRYTIPKQTGVVFYADGKLVPAGTYRVANGKTVKFTAKASVSTYRLTGTATWSFRF